MVTALATLEFTDRAFQVNKIGKTYINHIAIVSYHHTRLIFNPNSDLMLLCKVIRGY